MEEKVIQRRLNLLNAGLHIDGIIGSKTKFWIYGLQHSTSTLKEDGIYGSKTNGYLYSILEAKKLNTQHFKQYEFNCKCCNRNLGIHINLLIFLEGLRFTCGKNPILITSGYRCPIHNKNVGGASRSQHLYGRAADLIIHNRTVNSTYVICHNHNQNGGVGRYRSFTHVDCRDGFARW
jgi:zinc D-Ala-D-Ala carboxypeptidase